MDDYSKARRRAAQNAALLVCLRQQPASPQEKKCTVDGTSSLLSLRREMQLLDDFAFISSLEDNPNEVTAVCLETNQDIDGVTLRVAANTGCLLHVVNGLQAVADVMMQASSHGMYRTFVFKIRY